MAIGIDGYNTVFRNFAEFAQRCSDGGAGKAVITAEEGQPLNGRRVVSISNTHMDSVYVIRRGAEQKTTNDFTRALFRDAVIDIFGGEAKIPKNVKKAMLLADYDKGKPLTARRIAKVKAEVDKFASRLQPAFDAAKAKLDHSFGAESRFVAADEAMANGTTKVTRNQLHELASVALRRAVADKDALDVVAKCINTIILGGDGKFCTAEGIAQKVDAILANVAELRTAAKGNQAVITAGKNLLVAIRGKSIPQGLFARMVDAGLKMKTSDIRKLSPSSSGQQFHQAVEKFADNINDAMNKSGATKLMDGAEKLEPARGFFAEMHFAKCSASTLNHVRNALNSDTASQVATVYLDIGSGDINPGEGLSDNRREQVIKQSDVAMQMLNHLKAVVDIKCGVPENELGQVGRFKGEFDYEDVDAFDIREASLQGHRRARQQDALQRLPGACHPRDRRPQEGARPHS